jgi:putative membrane protein
MMWDYGGGWGSWMMFFLATVFVVALVVGVIFLVRAATQSQAPRRSSPEGPSPKDILKRRYAAGEIDREEYQQRLHDLEL